MSFPELGAVGAGILSAAAGQHREVPDWTQQQTGLDSRKYGSESGSGLQGGQGAGSSSEVCHGRRERDPYDTPALK